MMEGRFRLATDASDLVLVIASAVHPKCNANIVRLEVDAEVQNHGGYGLRSAILEEERNHATSKMTWPNSA